MSSRFKHEGFTQDLGGDASPVYLFPWKDIMSQVCGRGMSKSDVDLLENMTNYSGHNKNSEETWAMQNCGSVDADGGIRPDLMWKTKVSRTMNLIVSLIDNVRQQGPT
ncbi:hypothetical protein AAMO2058_000356400 [Amorphochlora amoebiformis]